MTVLRGETAGPAIARYVRTRTRTRGAPSPACAVAAAELAGMPAIWKAIGVGVVIAPAGTGEWSGIPTVDRPCRIPAVNTARPLVQVVSRAAVVIASTHRWSRHPEWVVYSTAAATAPRRVNGYPVLI